MIGYYVHHHGRGHYQRMRCIAEHLQTPMTVLSTLPRPADWTQTWIHLPPDADGSEVAPDADVTAHGTLHWAPIHHLGMQQRMAMIAKWVHNARPSLMVVDVSVEVTVFVRAMGVPVVIAAMPGDRTDPPHRLAYDLATALIAPWPESARNPHWPQALRRKTLFTGGFSRFDHRPTPVPGADGRCRVALLGGTGGLDITDHQIRRAVAATTDWRWDLIGVPGGTWIEDPWPTLCRADVIVTHAGQNAIAETAATRRPAIVIPQSRPHQEQRATAQILRAGDYATVIDTWPDDPDWESLLEFAASHVSRWPAWSPGDGAARAAHHIEELSRRMTVPPWA